MLLHDTYRERLKYLMLFGTVTEETFGRDRYLNQNFYRSHFWKKTRNSVIARDNGWDLGCSTHPIYGPVIVHHIVPVTIDMIREESPLVFDLDNLISVSEHTHKIIHFYRALPEEYTPRFPGDTTLW
jgi:hypothetical protein